MLRLLLLAVAVWAAAADPAPADAPDDPKGAALAAELAIGAGRDAEALERSQAALVLAGRAAGRLVRLGSLITMPAGADELREGSVLAGRFVVGRLLERGPWGQAHEGRDLEDRTVTLLRFSPAAGGRRAFSLAA